MPRADCYPAGFDAVLAGVDAPPEEEVDFSHWRCFECNAAVPTGETCAVCGLTEDESEKRGLDESLRYYKRVFGHAIHK